MRETFTDSKRWQSKIYFTENYVILEQFDRYENGEVYDVYFTIYDKNGRFINNEFNKTFA